MSPYNETDRNRYGVRFTASGVASDTPIAVTSTGPVYNFGGFLPNGAVVVYVVQAGISYTPDSQALDSNGSPSGAPGVPVPATSIPILPWFVPE